MTLLILYGLLAVGVSFLCSLLEASLLSLPLSYVKVLEEKGSRVGRTLVAMKTDIDRPLAAILTLNTIAHTVGAAGVGAQAAILPGASRSRFLPWSVGRVFRARQAGFNSSPAFHLFGP